MHDQHTQLYKHPVAMASGQGVAPTSRGDRGTPRRAPAGTRPVGLVDAKAGQDTSTWSGIRSKLRDIDHMPAERTLNAYLVEDNTIIRQNLTATLEELAGASVVGWADTEHGAIDALTRDGASWDLAIVDLFLKHGSGTGVIAACVDRNRKQKLVVLSNYASTDVRASCEKMGADAVFDKSTDIEELIDYCARLRAELDNL